MDSKRQKILNRLVNEVPEGLPVTASWLRKRIGCSRQLARKYVKNNWLANPARGIYVRNISKMTWLSALLSTQRVCGLDCHPSASTALSLLGFTQYLGFGDKSYVALTGENKPPCWLSKLPLPVSFQYNARHLFKNSDVGLMEHPLPEYPYSLQISSAPRAFLELLFDVSDEDSFNSAYELFEGMTSFNPSHVELLLLECVSVKVKRLFFLMSEKAGHQWGGRLTSTDYNLGSGKRVVVRGGKLNAKYAVTVPEGFND